MTVPDPISRIKSRIKWPLFVGCTSLLIVALAVNGFGRPIDQPLALVLCALVCTTLSAFLFGIIASKGLRAIILEPNTSLDGHRLYLVCAAIVTVTLAAAAIYRLLHAP